MEISDILDALCDKDDVKAYAKAKEIAATSELSDKYYFYTKEFAKLLNSDKSYIRSRAFILCCSQARWDDKGIIKEILPQMAVLFHDTKPTVVRQCLNAIKEVVVFRPDLTGDIEKEINKIDTSEYKESMASLIEKDRKAVQSLLEEIQSK